MIQRRAWTDLLRSGCGARPEAPTLTLLRLGLAAAATAVLMLAGAVLVFRQVAGALGAPAPAVVLAAGFVAMGAGMLPIAVGWGASDPSFRSPMAVAVIGGLITSTFLSLLVIPAVYTLVDDVSLWLRRVVWRRPLAQPPAA